MSDDLFGVVVDGRKLLFKYGDSYNRFSEEYYHYVKSNTPVCFIENDLLNLMYKNGIDYFRVPKTKHLLTMISHLFLSVAKKISLRCLNLSKYKNIEE